MEGLKYMLFAGAVLFFTGIAVFVGHFFLTTGTDAMLNAPAINESINANNVLNQTSKITARLDLVFVTLFFGYILVLLISSWLSEANPIFLFIFLILWILGIFISMPLSNAWETVTVNPSFGTTLTAFTVTNHILVFMPFYVGVSGIACILLLLMKPSK